MSSPAQTQHGLNTWPRSDYSLCALGRGWWRGETDLFSQWHPDKDGDWEGTHTGISAGLFGSTSSLFHLFIWSFLSFSPPACVGDTEMFAEVLCVAVALVLYVNTLGADFCYDDRYLDEWVASRPMLLSSAPNKCPLDTWIRHNSGYSSCFLNSYWTNRSVYQYCLVKSTCLLR